ncbi:MAG: MXAN_5187 C-terminal domain-containing protein [Myxococcota bacterium]
MPGRVEPAVDKKQLGDAEEVMKLCAELEAELNELKAQYDQHFLGLERLPPTKHHERFKKRVAELKGKFVRQTSVKFRVQQLTAKLTTYERLWDRTLKEIEAGTYSRDLFKARRHRKEREETKKKSGDADFHIDEDLDLSDLDGEDDLEGALAAAAEAVAKPAAPPAKQAPPVKPVTGSVPMVKPVTGEVPLVKPVSGSLPGVKPPTGSVPMVKPVTGSVPMQKPATNGGGIPKITAAGPIGSPPVSTPGAGSPPAPRPSTPPAAKPAATASKPPAAKGPVGAPDGGLTDQKIKAIYDAYVMAKKRCGEDTRSVTLDSVSATLKKQVPELMKQHQARSVEFKVVIKDGKAVLRALPKE